jgi:hypothetical protein
MKVFSHYKNLDKACIDYNRGSMKCKNVFTSQNSS